MSTKDLYTIEEARELLGGISRNSIYALLRDGRLGSVPIGRRRFISAAAIETFIITATTTDPPEARGPIPRKRAVQMRLSLKAPIVRLPRRQVSEG